jgi:hypothetical protein
LRAGGFWVRERDFDAESRRRGAKTLREKKDERGDSGEMRWAFGRSGSDCGERMGVKISGENRVGQLQVLNYPKCSK